MKESVNGNITALLQRWRKGDGDALAELTERVYHELYARARLMMLKEGRHSFSSTDLVGELYLRLMDERERDWQNRGHFYAVAATIMRHILINHAQARLTRKRGGDQARVTADVIERTPADLSQPEVIMQLDRGLTLLAEKDARTARIFELRNIVGLTAAEIAPMHDISAATVRREVAFARNWLSRYMREGV
jgi:RNA polymerase sigma factor (TIGR02999 family)